MAAARLAYLSALLGCGIFYIAYGEWFSWLLLLAVLGFPWLSLLLSIPAIRRFRLAPDGPNALLMGVDADIWLLGSCTAPMPPFRGKLQLCSGITGERLRYNADKGLPTDHCGSYTVTVEKARVYDYLGLFSFPVSQKEEKTVLIQPIPVPLKDIPDLKRYLARSWRPKPGGGFSETHELRLYRPGDRLNQVHWKLTAKTGKLILREPMEPQRGVLLVTMNLRGTPEELDRKFGRLLWLGNHLLQQDAPFTLRTLTGTGLLSFSVSSEQDLRRAVDTLLCTGAAAEGDIRSRPGGASWHYHIGGEADEKR